MNNLSREKWMRILLADPARSLAGRYLGMPAAAADSLFAWAERLDASSRRAALVFLELSPALLEKEGEEILSRWAAWGVQACRHSGEIACRVLEQGAAVARSLTNEAGEGWLAMGLALARSSERAAWAYFAQTSVLIEKSPGFDPQVWGSAALPLLESGWQVRQLAAEFLEATAPQAGALGADALGLLAGTAARIARHHGPIASSWIREGPALLLHTSAPLRPALLDLLAAASQGAAPRFSEAARLAAEAAPKLKDDAKAVFKVAAALFAVDAEGALTLLREAPLLPGLGEPQDSWREGTEAILAAAADFPSGHPEAAACLLQALPQLRRLAAPPEIPKWIAQGVLSAQGDKAKAAAYFSLASRSSRAQLAAYSEGIPYAQLAREMGLFAQGLCGRPLPVSVLAGASTEEESLSERPLPATDGETIFLPELFWGFGSRENNHRAARLSIAHQAAHFELGTFAFDAGRLCTRKSAIAELGRFAPRGRGEAGLTWFFSRFALEALARDFFASFEGYRIDMRLQTLYRGLSADMDWLWRVERGRRPLLEEALRRAGPLGLLCELLVRRSLGESALPAELAEAAGAGNAAGNWTLTGLELAQLWEDLGAFFESLARPEATVEDSAQRTAELYHLVTLFLGAPRRGRTLVQADEGPPVPPPDLARGAEAEGEIPKEIAGAYEPLDPVSHRGDTDPAAAQERILDLAQGGEVVPGETGISPEEMQAFLDEHPEFDFEDALRGGGTAGFPGEQGPDTPPPAGEAFEAPREEFPLRRRMRRPTLHAPESLETLYLYDEWDHTIDDFRTGWCTVREQEAPEADPSDLERRAAESAGIIRETIQQFERIRPELMRRERGQPDGEEVDLSRALEAKADRRRGLPWPDRLYERRVKAERNVATLLLLDMSASTGERVPPVAPVADGPTPPPPETYATRWDPPAPTPVAGGMDGREVPSVLDVEKEALLVMTRALEYLGDSFAIHGFSGHGREHVEVFRIKDFGERSHPKILRRIAGIRPRQSTRMGAAIRHATWRLSREEARYKSLILISDGYPQDMDYGLDRRDETYALLDTRAALTESELAGIHPFCVTIDRAGYDYLGKMVPHEAYLVIDEVLELPKLLPKIYRRITW